MEPSSGHLTCLIVDDSAAFRSAVRGLLDRAGILVVAAAIDLDTAVDGYRREHPDVVLVDIDLGEHSGFDVVDALRSVDADAGEKIIMVSTHDPDDFADMIAESPARGFIPKFALSAERITAMLGLGPR
ncbi:response regulator [Gordonia sp. NPDC003376]